ncbi:MAG TPA: sensor histidine kinase [Streptosporangiaceae bacterium]|nr:sensor histidine kinase [Streptosporangiaceae bacterium]
MGSRRRSIRLRIYFLVAIPLVTMIGLLSYVVTTSVHNAINLDRAPNLFNATAVPAAVFTNYLQAERRAAAVYLFEPTQANLAAYVSAINTTNAHEPAFAAAMNSDATKSSETPGIRAAINAVLGGISQLPDLRKGVEARLIAAGQPMTALDAIGAYSLGIQNGPKLFLAEAATVADPTAASQALALIATVSAHEAISEEDALLAGMLAANKASQADRAAFAEMASTRQGDTVDYQSLFDPYNLAVYNAGLKGTAPLVQELTRIEGAVAGGVPIGQLHISPANWKQLTDQLLTANFNAGVSDVAAQLAVDHRITHAAWVRVAYTSGIALAGLLLTIIMTTLVGRGIIRRLRGLETNALELAENKLPDVVGRLRRGDDVDVAAEAPPLRVGGDEIGRVGQAFDLVRQTAIRSAVEEARLRRGLNDVFRSLARRSQSLLHRQLTLLDQMERRASDPEALDDLFRLDHLTTRMRRHAEGLVILAGAPAGRSWSSPVRMVDVMRGAIAEVEDYARVSVATRSQAALSGSAVADVIHLLAELVENATTLSPPYTSVRVSGETVANGFAIEVEDRGLGMSEQRLAELNERLINPPEFNPSDSEQLGLFVVSQLARRHGIRVTLKASPYGGTEAVVLIPRHLVVAEEAFRASLPGEPVAITGADAALAGLTGGATGPNGNGFPAAALGTGQFHQGSAGLPSDEAAQFDQDWPFDQPTDRGTQITGGPRISGAMRRTGSFPDGLTRGGQHTGQPGTNGGTANGNGHGADGFPAGDGSGLGAGFDPAIAADGPSGLADAGSGAEDGDLPRRTRGRSGGGRSPGAGIPSFNMFTPHRDDDPQASPAPAPPAPPASLAGSGFPGTGSPFGATTTPYGTGQSTAFSGWPAEPPAAPAPPAPAGPGTSAGKVSRPPWELPLESGSLPVVPELPPDDDGFGGNGNAEPDDFKGLPRRVKQASIAPQLRGEPTTRVGRPSTGGSAPPGAEPAEGPSPAEIRATMSALQRGLQEGRSQRDAGGEPPWESEPAAEGEPDGA